MASSQNRKQHNATQSDRLARVTIADPTSPFYGKSFKVVQSPGGTENRRSVTIVLPGGQHRIISREATNLSERGTTLLEVAKLPLISVRTILSVVRFVRNQRILRGEGNNDTRNRHATDGRIPGDGPAKETISEPLGGARNGRQTAAGFQLGAAHCARKRRARRGDSP